MCGRFTLTHDIHTIANTILSPQIVEVPASLQNIPRYNIAPTQNIVTILHDNSPHMELLRWGLIPAWAKEESIGAKMINARAETLAEKASFKKLLAARRCLIVADGFYEWSQEPGSKVKTPMYITLKNTEAFTFAGLWDSWRNSAGQQIRTCTIITTQPNELMQTIHNRMPAILTAEARATRLDPTERDTQMLTALLTAYASQEMAARPVSRLVNDPRRDSAELIA